MSSARWRPFCLGLNVLIQSEMHLDMHWCLYIGDECHLCFQTSTNSNGKRQSCIDIFELAKCSSVWLKLHLSYVYLWWRYSDRKLIIANSRWWRSRLVPNEVILTLLPKCRRQVVIQTHTYFYILYFWTSQRFELNTTRVTTKRIFVFIFLGICDNDINENLSGCVAYLNCRTNLNLLEKNNIQLSFHFSQKKKISRLSGVYTL